MESLEYKEKNPLFIYTRCNVGFPGLYSQTPGASDENHLSQLPQLGVTSYHSAQPDTNISFPVGGICVFPSSDEKSVSLVSCQQHNLFAETGGG